MGSERTRRDFLGLAAAAASAGLAGCPGGPPTNGGAAAGGGTATPTGTPGGSTPTDSAAEGRYVELYERIVGSVVLVRVPGGGLGSGFVYDGEGHVVTNYHVVTDADTVEIQYAQGKSVTGTVVGTDKYSDLAVVEVDERPAYAEPLDLHPGEPQIGTRVAAVGSPYGLEGSMTNGIVSGVNRLVPSPQADFDIPNAIQTDAPVNPGNSGGPLVNMDGDVLGVVNSGGGENIAFAISAALVERVVPVLVQQGEYRHPTLGVNLATVTSAVARANDLEEARGILVTGVARGAPAAGVLRPSTDSTRVNGFLVPVGGDVILSIEGTKLRSPRDLLTYLELDASPGETVQLTILRDGEQQTVSVELTSREQLRS